MSQENESGKRTFTAGEALEAFRRVKLSSGTAVYADAFDPEWIGTTLTAVASGALVVVKLRRFPGTRKMISASSAAAGARAYAAADGKVDDVTTGGPGVGYYVDAPGAAGIAAEILLDEPGNNGGLLHAAIASSTAVTAGTATTFSNANRTIDGGQLKVGDILRIKAAGIVTTSTGSETTTFKIIVGTEAVASTAAVDATNGDVWRIEVDVIVRVVGASGKLLAHGTVANGVPGTATALPFCGAEVTEDISGAAVPVIAQVTNSSTGESVLCHAFTIELIRQ